jgi:hypothetical protein
MNLTTAVCAVLLVIAVWTPYMATRLLRRYSGDRP